MDKENKEFKLFGVMIPLKHHNMARMISINTGKSLTELYRNVVLEAIRTDALKLGLEETEKYGE